MKFTLTVSLITLLIISLVRTLSANDWESKQLWAGVVVLCSWASAIIYFVL